MNYAIESLEETQSWWPEFPRWPRAYLSHPKFPCAAPVLARWCFERVRDQLPRPRELRLPMSDVRRLHKLLSREFCRPAQARTVAELFERVIDLRHAPVLTLPELGLDETPDLRDDWDPLMGRTMLLEVCKVRRVSYAELLEGGRRGYPTLLAYACETYRQSHIGVRTPPSLLPPVDDEAPPAPPRRPAVPFDPAMPWRRENAA